MAKKPKMRSVAPKDTDASSTEKLLMLTGFVGQDLLMEMRSKSLELMRTEIIEITGGLMGGRFRLTVTFEGETAH